MKQYYRLIAVPMAIPALILVCYMLLASGSPLSASVPELVALSAIISVLITLSQTDIFRPAPDSSASACTPTRTLDSCNATSKKDRSPWSAGFIISFALLIRILFLFHSPSLSDDIYRYSVDGSVLLSGHNPYAAAPADLASVDQSISALIPFVNHSEIITIYPPVAQVVFGAGAFAGKLLSFLSGGESSVRCSVTGMKIVMTLIDIATCILIVLILKKMKLPLRRAVLYAWNPLPVIEIGSSGHVDAAAVLFLLAAVYVALNSEIKGAYWWNVLRISGFVSGFLMALSILTKWTPLIFMPGLIYLIKCPRRKSAALITAILTIIATITAFWPDITNSFATLNLYVQNWEFSGLIFRILRDLMVGRFPQPGSAARVVIALIFIWFSRKEFMKLRTDRTAAGVMRSYFMLAILWLILSPTLYPWYALYLAALLPFSPYPAGIVLCWSVLLSYRVMIMYSTAGIWLEDGTTPVMIMAAPAMAYTADYVFNSTTSGHRSVKKA